MEVPHTPQGASPNQIPSFPENTGEFRHSTWKAADAKSLDPAVDATNHSAGANQRSSCQAGRKSVSVVEISTTGLLKRQKPKRGFTRARFNLDSVTQVG